MWAREGWVKLRGSEDTWDVTWECPEALFFKYLEAERKDMAGGGGGGKTR